MIRKLKTHIVYKKDGIEIRPATLNEEYDVGSWISSYPWIKLGYENIDYSYRYSDIIYVIKLNNSIIGYFMADNIVNVGENLNLPLYSKELVLVDFVVDHRAYVKYSKILMDYLIEYSIYNGYKAISYTKVEKYSDFDRFIKKHYKPIEIVDKIYLINQNPRIRSCQKHLTLYPNDKVSIDNLYLLYDLNFDIKKTKCHLKLNENEDISVDRLTGIITFPSNVSVNNSLILNEKTKTIVDMVVKMFYVNQVKNIKINYSIDNPLYYEAIIDDLLYVSKSFEEIRNDIGYVNSLIERGYVEVAANNFRYSMNGSAFSYSSNIYKLKK